MTSVPAISIITPVWNGLPYIKETIDSVLSQDFQDWELLIGDNESTDGTSEYLQSLTDPRIRVFRHEKNVGVYRNIRFLYSKAKAPIAVGLCADDYFHPGGLAMVVNEWATASPDTAYITFNWKERRNHSKLTLYGYNTLPRKLDLLNSRLGFFLFGNIPGNFSEVSAKVDLFNAASDYIDYMKFAADFEFWSRLAKTGPVVLSDANIVYIRRHDRVAATYMATKGEFFTDTVAVYETLIDELSAYYDRKKLVRYYNIETRSFQLRDALIAILRARQFTNFKIFMTSKSSIFWPKWLQLIVCLPFALYEDGRLRLSVVLAKGLINGRK